MTLTCDFLFCFDGDYRTDCVKHATRTARTHTYTYTHKRTNINKNISYTRNTHKKAVTEMTITHKSADS